MIKIKAEILYKYGVSAFLESFKNITKKLLTNSLNRHIM